jgi:EAL and modified HD-GYP domain-containing signal transduction protein
VNTPLPPSVGLELPAFLAADAQLTPGLQALRAAGHRLLLRGRPVREMPREALASFSQLVLEAAELEAGGSAPLAGGKAVVAGIRTRADMVRAFERKAQGVFGWPVDDDLPPATGKPAMATDFQATVELMRRVDAEEPVDRLEAVIKTDPTLGFKLMRYMNSAAFGLSVEISSFRHALMLLGYQRLKRWLALLMVSAGKDREMKPLLHGAVRRGLLMEELARGTGDEQMRGEAFICGVFSLLDVMVRQPLDALLKSLPVPAGVQQALVDGSGPLAPLLAVARAAEQESPFDLREAVERAMLAEGEVNRCITAALAAAAQID